MNKQNNQPVFIFRVKTTIGPSGEELNKEQLTVQSGNLEECRKHFDELWGKE